VSPVRYELGIYILEDDILLKIAFLPIFYFLLFFFALIRRTNGQCLGTFKTDVKFYSLPPPCSVSHCHPLHPLLSLFIVFLKYINP
jgi:hypothetical protein